MDDFWQLKLLSSFFHGSNIFFSYLRYIRQKQAVVTLTLYNSGWDRLAVTQFLTLSHPRLGLELDPYFGELLG